MPLPAICLDCEPLRDRHSGFSHFVLPLAHELVRQNHRYRLSCYVPPAEVGALGTEGVEVVFTADGVVVIDPAAHGGHGLTDLAMLHVFGVPGLDRISDAYAEEARLEPGWRELVGLHQLHPLLVHAVSHGPEDGAEAASVARRYR